MRAALLTSTSALALGGLALAPVASAKLPSNRDRTIVVGTSIGGVALGATARRAVAVWGPSRCAEVLREMEPNVEWSKAFLARRLLCYRLAKDPAGARAEEDLAELLGASAEPFAPEAELPKAGASAGVADAPVSAPTPTSTPSGSASAPK